MRIGETAPKSSHDITCELLKMKAESKSLKAFPIGRSVLGYDLPCGVIGCGETSVLFVGAHHGLEWITSYILLRFCEDLLGAFKKGEKLLGYDPEWIMKNRRLFILPLLNFDGVDLVLRGIQKGNPYRERLIMQNGGSDDFSSVWQANVRGVDLNHNYSAGWVEGKALERSLGIEGPGPTRYSGPFWESEPEVKALCHFVRRTPLRHVCAYHTQGEVIFDSYDGRRPGHTEELSSRLSAASGYRIAETDGIASFSGFKDWVIDKFDIPGFTIEAGLGRNPLPFEDFEDIYERNLEMMLILSTF